MKWRLEYVKVPQSGPLQGVQLSCTIVYPDRASVVGPRDRLAEASLTQEILTDCVGAPFKIARGSVRLKAYS